MDIFPVHIRACIFVLAAYGFATLYMLFFYRYKYLLKWAACWAIITGVAFVSGHFVILAVTVFLISLFLIPKERSEQVKYYFVLLPIIPLFVYDISGPFGINLLLDLTYPRVLSLAILVPAFIVLIKKSGGIKKDFLDGGLDKLIFLYVVLLSLLAFRNTTLTSGLRETFSYIALDIFLPYYVISRSLRSLDDFRRVFLAIIFSAVMLSFLGLMEQKLHWSFFMYLPDLMDFRPVIKVFSQIRGGFLRINATMAPIPLGYFMVFAMGVLIFMKALLPRQRLFFYGTLALFLIILIFTGSRGAWLTGMVFLLTYTYLEVSSHWLRLSLLVGLAGLVLFGNLIFSVIGDVNVNSVDEHGTFQYRVDLIKHSAVIIKDNLLFGTDDPNRGGALESMRQGEGIIDIVNSYLGLLLFYGIVGFSLFVAIFLSTLGNLYRAVKSVKRNRKIRSLGNMLIAMTVATLVMIGTVSSVNYIPIYYWSLIALSCAYVRMCKRYQFQSLEANDNGQPFVSTGSKLITTLR